ncbi:hypothetical protein L1049_012429 [Liquidambar formosana]|uniref:beta-galactosidase n=1 Tax=Liquidambar formosana TaxID=63359 RepID=A0AAP0N6W9_LIQFO
MWSAYVTASYYDQAPLDEYENTKNNRRISRSSQKFDSTSRWEEFKDDIPNFLTTSLKSNTLLEHMNTTKDESDYLWYTFRFQQNSSCTEPVLHVESLGHVTFALVNNKYVGAAHGSHDVKGFTIEYPVSLNNEMNNISLLSVMVGLPDSGAYLERRIAGLTRVEIKCTKNESYNFINYKWGYQVGLLGERLQIYKPQNLSNVEWSKFGISNNQTFTWYKILFDEPMGNDPVALNLTTMGKGEAWINGQSIGRYWVSFYNSARTPSQTLYHVPRSFLKTSGNLLILLEEAGGDPLHISLDTISTKDLHEHISYYHLPQ